MANSKSAKKRIRQNAVRRLRNRYRLSTTRSAIKKLKGTDNKEEATAMLPDVISRIDRCAKKNIFHKNKASNLKSKLMRHVSSL